MVKLPSRMVLSSRLLEVGRSTEATRTTAWVLRLLPSNERITALHEQAQAAPSRQGCLGASNSVSGRPMSTAPLLQQGPADQHRTYPLRESITASAARVWRP